MKKLLFLSIAALLGATLATSAVPGAFAQTGSAPTSGRSFECHSVSTVLTLQHRAPVHVRPYGKSPVAYFAARGSDERVGAYCDNSDGQRWYCIAACDFDSSLNGFWVWEEYFLA